MGRFTKQVFLNLYDFLTDDRDTVDSEFSCDNDDYEVVKDFVETAKAKNVPLFGRDDAWYEFQLWYEKPSLWRNGDSPTPEEK